MKNREVCKTLFAIRYLLIVIIGFYGQPAYGEQMKFSKVLVDDNYQFSYQWTDHQNNPQSIGFAFPAKKIFNRYRDFSIYQPSRAKEYVNKKLRKHFKKNPVQGAQVHFKKDNDDLQINIRSKEQKTILEISQLIEKLQVDYQQEYLTKKYYHEFVTPDQQKAIKPNHGKIAIESVEDFKPLKPIILEQSSVKNIRKVSNYVLSFVQNIPYSTLESRVSSSGAGFNPPLKLLYENQGDCDSKVTLTVSLLRTLMPRIKMALVYIDKHALIGINIKPEDDDITVVDNDITYVLAEPTGPALFAIGTIAEDSEQAIYNGHYTLEPFHSPVKSNRLESIEEDVDEFSDKQ